MIILARLLLIRYNILSYCCYTRKNSLLWKYFIIFLGIFFFSLGYFTPKWSANYKTCSWIVSFNCYSLVIYEAHTISFQTFFIWGFKIVVDSWKFTMSLLYILWDDWPIFMISGSNEQLQQQLEYTLLKPDCHSWWISKMQSDTLEEQYAIKFCFKLGKNATETYGMLQTTFGASCINRASVFE